MTWFCLVFEHCGWFDFHSGVLCYALSLVGVGFGVR